MLSEFMHSYLKPTDEHSRHAAVVVIVVMGWQAKLLALCLRAT